MKAAEVSRARPAAGNARAGRAAWLGVESSIVLALGLVCLTGVAVTVFVAGRAEISSVLIAAAMGGTVAPMRRRLRYQRTIRVQ
jgi:hypothetical protein